MKAGCLYTIRQGWILVGSPKLSPVYSVIRLGDPSLRKLLVAFETSSEDLLTLSQGETLLYTGEPGMDNNIPTFFVQCKDPVGLIQITNSPMHIDAFDVQEPESK